ncbi:hypothetical protein ACHAPD_006347 [Fusarium lateritium]
MATTPTPAFVAAEFHNTLGLSRSMAFPVVLANHGRRSLESTTTVRNVKSTSASNLARTARHTAMRLLNATTPTSTCPRKHVNERLAVKNATLPPFVRNDFVAIAHNAVTHLASVYLSDAPKS